MFNNPFDRYSQRYPRSTKYGPIFPSSYLGASPYLPTALSRRSGLAGGMGGHPYGAVQCRMPYQVPVLHQVDQCHFHSHCDSACDQSQATAQRKKCNTLKTKDIIVRGKAFAVRESYLQDQPKFEKELREFVEKKNEDTLPGRVINMLLSFINEEEYCNTDPYDEVTLCILAHNAGAKSVVICSLDKIKEMEDNISSYHMVVEIIITIMRSADVPDKLKGWLEEFLSEKVQWFALSSDPYFILNIVNRYPETYDELLVLLGYSMKMPPPESRIL